MAVILAALCRCDGSLGCLSCQDGFVYPDPPPPGGEVLESAIVGHLQESGVTFWLTHLSDILRAQLPTDTAGGIERAIIYLAETPLWGGCACDLVDCDWSCACDATGDCDAGCDCDRDCGCPCDTTADCDGGSFSYMTARDGCIGPTEPDLCPPRFADDDESRGPTHRSKIELNLDTIDDTADVTFIPGGGSIPDAVEVNLYDLDVFLDIAFFFELGGDVVCHVHDEDVHQPAVHIEQLRFTVTLEVDADNSFYGEVSDVQVQLDSLLGLDVSPCNDAVVCDDPACHDGEITGGLECEVLCRMTDFVFAGAELLTDVLQPLLDWIAPSIIEMLVNGALDEVNGSPLAISGRYELADILGPEGMLAPLLLEPTAIELGAIPNDDAFIVTAAPTGRGMSLSLDAGTTATPSPCVPTISVPRFAAQLGELPFFDGIDGDERYHVVAALSEAFIAQALFSSYQVGGGCWAVSSEDIERLTGGAITLGALAVLAPSLAEIGEPRAPLLFVTHPTQTPTVKLGTGETTYVDGEPVVDSLIQLDLGEVGISIFAFVDDSYLRLATVAADVFLGVPLVRTPENTLELGIDQVEITNITEVYNEALTNEDFGRLVEAVVSVTLGAIVNNVGSFDLDLGPIVSRMLGGAPVYARINAVERYGGEEDGYLVTYVTFCDEEDRLNPDRPPCYSPTEGGEPPPPWVGPRAVADAPLAVPAASRVWLSVRPGLEYRYRIDEGYWTGFRRAEGGRLLLLHPLLDVPGLHRVELMARRPGAYWQVTTTAVDLLAVE
ncbi:hypothetical protein ACFL6C_04615 [Myxococcota bacterium]